MQTITTTPTREQIDNLMVGDIVPNCFGELRPITTIHAKREDINGKLFACFYTKFGDNSALSGSLKEGEAIITLHPIQY